MWEQPKLTIACLPKVPTSDISASLRRRMRLRTVEGQTRDTILVNIEQLYVDEERPLPPLVLFLRRF